MIHTGDEALPVCVSYGTMINCLRGACVCVFGCRDGVGVCVRNRSRSFDKTLTIFWVYVCACADAHLFPNTRADKSACARAQFQWTICAPLCATWIHARTHTHMMPRAVVVVITKTHARDDGLEDDLCAALLRGWIDKFLRQRLQGHTNPQWHERIFSTIPPPGIR